MNKFTFRWYKVKAMCSGYSISFSPSGKLNCCGIPHYCRIVYEDEITYIYAICFNNGQLKKFKDICNRFYKKCVFVSEPIKVDFDGR